MKRTWNDRHRDDLTRGQRFADVTARTLGSWAFIGAQTVLVCAWIGLNLAALVKHWDPYPFILLNLMFSVQAAYAAPIIMMSQNRQAERDRYQANADFATNQKAELEIEDVQRSLQRIEQTLQQVLSRVGEGGTRP